MKKINLSVTDQKIICDNAVHIVTDSKNYVTAEFTFSSEWDGMTKTAVFKGANGSYCLLLRDNACIVPQEALVSGFSVSVFGMLDDVRITTDSVYIAAVKSGYEEGQTPAEPTKTVYEELLGTITAIKEIDSEVRTAVAENAEEISQLRTELDGFESYDDTELIARVSALESRYGECEALAQEILNGEV